MKAIHRLMQYIDYKGFNNSQFEKKNSLSNGYLGTQFKRKADLGEGILSKILKNSPDLSPEWLLTGNGKMLKSDSVNMRIIGDKNIQATGNIDSCLQQVEELTEKLNEKEEQIKQLIQTNTALAAQLNK